MIDRDRDEDEIKLLKCEQIGLKHKCDHYNT